MDPRTLYSPPPHAAIGSSAAQQYTIAPPPPASTRDAHGSTSSISSSRASSLNPGRGRTVYDHPSGPARPVDRDRLLLQPPSPAVFSTSAPSEASSFLASPPLPVVAFAPSTAPPVAAFSPTPVAGTAEAGTGGKVRKGKDRASRPLLGLRMKSEDGLAEGGANASKARAQYSACGGCRMRRVRCDLHDIKAHYRTNVLPQHLSQLLTHPNSQAISDNGGYELVSGELVGLDGNRIACTNCKERNLRCVDGFAAKELSKNPTASSVSTSPTMSVTTSPTMPTGPVFSASGKPKLLRKGKRIQMVQSAFGGAPFDPSASTPARGAQGTRRTTVSSVGSVKTESSTRSPDMGRGEELDGSDLGDLCLTASFLKSPFFKRLCFQRPLIQPDDFERRFLSTNPPQASNLGPVGALLLRVLFAWARSFGVDSDGNEDSQPPSADVRRQRQKESSWIVQRCLADVDRLGVLRKPSWEGAQALLLLLPLTEADSSSPLERLAMYDCAFHQVAALSVTHGALRHSRAGDSFGAQPQKGVHDAMTEVRLYWYSFVHEGIKTGLKGGKLVLDEEDFAAFQTSIANQPFARGPSYFTLLSQYAAAPIRIAHASRLVHHALTGPKARRAPAVDVGVLYEAWAAIDSCWEDFERLRHEAQGNHLMLHDELQRFCDGWMIFLFECQSVIREALYERYSRIVYTPRSEISASKAAPEAEVNRLHAIAEAKCVAMAKSVITIVWRNLGGPLFQFDCGLVRDGTYFVACILAAEDGTPDEMRCCLTALNDMRWAFSKADERAEHVQAIWNGRVEREASTQKSTNVFTPSDSSAFPFSQQQARVPGDQRPMYAVRNHSYQSELSDASYQSSAATPSEQYTPAFFNADDVHLPPIQAQSAEKEQQQQQRAQWSPVPPTLLRGLNIADESLQQTPMWTDSCSPVGKQHQQQQQQQRQQTSGPVASGQSTPSGYTSTHGESPVQSLSSIGPLSAPRGQTAAGAGAANSNPYLSSVPASFDPRTSPMMSATSGDFFHPPLGPAGTQAGSYTAAPPTAFLQQSPMQQMTETFAPYGDEAPRYASGQQEGLVTHNGEPSAVYTEFYPSTT